MSRRTNRRLIAAVSLCVAAPAMADIDTETGWLTWLNTHSLGGKWSLSTDLQLRSADNWDNVRNVLVRPSVGYAVNGRVTASLGYLLNRTFDPVAPDTTEHRVWQQLSISQPLPRVQLTHRLRLEQRFIERAAQPDVESVRFRYMVRALAPIHAPPEGATFTRGAYVALQSEGMAHLSGENNLNGKTFDQLRAYAGIGWRINRKADIEAGYQLQYLNGRTVDTRNHVILVAATTRF